MREDTNAPSAPRALTGEHVLVVDDNDMLRDIVVKQLASLGYQVSEAADANSALEILRERTDIDLLFTDIVMPGGMSGYDLAEEAQQLRPDLRVMFTSGYSKDTVDLDGGGTQKGELLKKPYRRKELEHMLRKVLDG